MSELDQLKAQADHIYHAWDEALAKNDVEGLVSLYATDAILESPLVPYLMETDHGICRGKGEIRKLAEKVVQRKPSIRKYFRKKYFTDGKTLMWEYPRETPEGDQMDFVEVMELNQGLIQHHKIYWGWRGFKVIQEDEYKQ